MTRLGVALIFYALGAGVVWVATKEETEVKVRKIEAMHAMYGVELGEKCRDCCNLASYTQSRT